jgi:hypothetical protein
MTDDQPLVRELQAIDTTVVFHFDYDTIHDPDPDGHDGDVHAAVTDALTETLSVRYAWVQHVGDYTLDVATDGEHIMTSIISDADMTVWTPPDPLGPEVSHDPATKVRRVITRLPNVTAVPTASVREHYTVERYDTNDDP